MFENAYELERYNRAFAIVTIIGHKGTVPRATGRMVVAHNGQSFGTIGGGKAEQKARALAVELLKCGKCSIATFPVRKRGEITVYIDIPVKDRKILIIGSGHVARAVADCFYRIKWRVIVADSHCSELIGFPPVDRIAIADIDGVIKSEMLNRNSAAVITDPEKAETLIPILLSSELFYLGILASRKWTFKLDDPRIHVPVGLSIGAESPEEIAVSVAAEVLSSFTGFNARPCSKDGLIVIRGAGDLASGVAVRLFRAGYRIVMLDIEKPTVIRRTVSFAEAFYDGEMTVEGVKGILVPCADDAKRIAGEGLIPLLVDPDCSSLSVIKPIALIDAIIAKKNLGTNKEMAPFTVALGPGFTAGIDVDAVIETKRGHFLGSVITSGSAIPNSGIPGVIAGFGKERVIHAQASGIFKEVLKIGDLVKAGDVIAYIDDYPVKATIDGKLRGLLHTGLHVPAGFKIADIDPRGTAADHTTISDKARAIGGGVLEALDGFMNRC